MKTIYVIDKQFNEIRIIDILPADDISIDDKVSSQMQAKKIKRIIDSALNEREKLVIKLRYGIDTGKPLTQRETADILNISRSYISRIEKKAIEKLRLEIEK